jgi:hypothetical protein
MLEEEGLILFGFPENRVRFPGIRKNKGIKIDSEMCQVRFKISLHYRYFRSARSYFPFTPAIKMVLWLGPGYGSADINN